ncbi:uncharacterized protein LOC131060975 isoform X2 [Cryptomeria japonica]|uniref:uncharacterized protein LOC131060975 isoform X2 n=1 Tax=Cryptomeria japonica TaxID=3369 RepID=UPI0027DA5B2B|nr:uncharacterized protein LOC131060975 isoform X2 [Cryptomeria japonica]
MAERLDEVTLVMRLATKKFERFLEDAHTRIYVLELSYDFTWSRENLERTPFVNTLAACVVEINEGRRVEKEFMAQLATHGAVLVRQGKQIIWMEGPLGWTSWIDN